MQALDGLNDRYGKGRQSCIASAPLNTAPSSDAPSVEKDKPDESFRFNDSLHQSFDPHVINLVDPWRLQNMLEAHRSMLDLKNATQAAAQQTPTTRPEKGQLQTLDAIYSDMPGNTVPA